MRDERGFIVSGPDLPMDGRRAARLAARPLPYHLETSVPGVFVAGDARAESAKRVASAVGEGAMAVMLVHRYLESVTMTRTAARADPDRSCGTLFLFEKLTDEQLDRALRARAMSS